MKSNLKLVASVLMGVCLMAALPSIAAAQQDLSQKEIASLDLDGADVREAIRMVFKNLDVSYSIDPEVQGPVTVHLKRITFGVAMESILRQVDATYRIEAGVYEVVKKKSETGLPANVQTRNPELIQSFKIIRRIKIRSADPAFIAAMLGAAKGSQNYDLAPEKSTIDKTQQSGGGQGSSGGSGFGSGNSGGFGSGNSGGSGFGNNSGSGSNGGGRGSIGG